MLGENEALWNRIAPDMVTKLKNPVELEKNTCRRAQLCHLRRLFSYIAAASSSMVKYGFYEDALDSVTPMPSDEEFSSEDNAKFDAWLTDPVIQSITHAKENAKKNLQGGKIHESWDAFQELHKRIF